MKTAVYSAHDFELEAIDKANNGKHELKFINTYLNEDTVVLSRGCRVVSIFANDDASGTVLEKLKEQGIEFLALRSAGYNHVDLKKAHELGIKVANVPEYSPFSVAEHAVTLMLALNRKIIRANSRVKELNFSLDGLTGFDMNGKTAGIIGTGKIGAVVARILHGFGCRLLGYDRTRDPDVIKNFGLEYKNLDELCRLSDIITLHVPLTPDTQYIINNERIMQMKPGVMLINTGRGGLVETREVINALKTGHIGYLGLDVYEEEKGLFFEDHSEDILQDDVIARLMTFKNVLITSHQGFLTSTSLKNISETTFHNIDCWEKGIKSENEL